MPKIVLKADNIKKTFVSKSLFSAKTEVHALKDVSFELFEKETLALVGESGCGKSTLAKVLMQIEPATSGEVELFGRPMKQVPMAEYRASIQMIFQDPYSSINPRKKARDIIGEPLVVSGNYKKDEIEERVLEAMKLVGLRPEYAQRFPHMFSGGQRQRIGIARALVVKPKIMICDEPVSALDVSIQAQILNLLMDLQDELGLSYLFISHDLSVVRHVADRVMVIDHGEIVEARKTEDIFSSPQHAYTKKLLSSVPYLER